MAHQVRLTPRAVWDIGLIYEYIAADSRANAQRWHAELYSRIDRLGEMPRAYPVAPEYEGSRFELRETFFGNYRIIFSIDDDSALVYVVTVRHAAREPLSPEDIEPLP